MALLVLHSSVAGPATGESRPVSGRAGRGRGARHYRSESHAVPIQQRWVRSGVHHVPTLQWVGPEVIELLGAGLVIPDVAPLLDRNRDEPPAGALVNAR